MSEHKRRKRSSYNNRKSYDDELALVLELLEESKDYEEAVAAPFKEAFDKLIKMYELWLPFYFKTGVNNKELTRLISSLVDEKGRIKTDISETLKEIEDKTTNLEIQYLTAWLILDYELTAKQTADSIKLDPQSYMKFMNNTKAHETIKQPWCKDNKTYIDRVKEATSEMNRELKMVIVQGIKRGWSVDRMTEILKNITGTAEYKARRLIRTETMAVYSKVTKEMYLERGIEYVEIIGDAACGGICLDYVGEALPLREAEIGDDLPPYHPNCCCSFCSYTEFDEIDIEESEEDVGTFD